MGFGALSPLVGIAGSMSANAGFVNYRFLDGWLFAKLLLFMPAKSPEC
jgi:hypothetical protein